MSAQFIVKFKGDPMRFIDDGIKHEAISTRLMAATIFISEPEAWTACVDYKLDAEFCEVVSL